MVLIFATALLFYGLFPLWGAWRVRRTWKRFREAALEALQSPEVDFSLLQPDSPTPQGSFRLSGTLEAFEGDDRLWIGNDRVSASVSLEGVPVYFLDEQPLPFGVGVEPPRRAEAASLGALPEGTRFLVSGSLVRDRQERVLFGSSSGHPLLVLAFEGPPATVLARAVFAGRPAVDLWNSWTPLSVGIGFLLLLVLAYTDLRTTGDHSSGLVALALALLPSTFFLPPGIVFFYAFARFWARGRDSRARADLAKAEGSPRHPLRRFGPLQCEVIAQLFLFLGAVGNGILLVFLLRLWIP